MNWKGKILNTEVHEGYSIEQKRNPNKTTKNKTKTDSKKTELFFFIIATNFNETSVA